MENTKAKRCCSFLKSIDQTGVPVTLNWLGDSTHKTRIGGAVSIIGMCLIGSFIFGSIYTFFASQTFRTQSLINDVNSSFNVDCSAEGNKCQFLNSTTFMPFVLLVDNNAPGTKVANLSTVIVPEFYTYQIYANGSDVYEWYDTVDCIDLYSEIFGSYAAIPTA